MKLGKDQEAVLPESTPVLGSTMNLEEAAILRFTESQCTGKS